MAREQRRGDQLRHHILLTAKEVFLETGYERASMDTVAARAETSKRSLYAHFESKDKLFGAVMDRIGELFAGKLRTPDAYAEEAAEAVTLFCGRFLQLMVWEQQVRTSRLSIAEAARLPGSSSSYFDAMFATTYQRLGGYLATRYGMTPEEGSVLAEELIGRAVLPRLFRTLLNAEDPIKDLPGEESLAQDVDLAAIRRAVATTLPG
jgi:AcrR family transcriptional regulator